MIRSTYSTGFPAKVSFLKLMALAESLICPSLVNFIALPIRFISICLDRVSSRYNVTGRFLLMSKMNLRPFSFIYNEKMVSISLKKEKISIVLYCNSSFSASIF